MSQNSEQSFELSRNLAQCLSRRIHIIQAFFISPLHYSHFFLTSQLDTVFWKSLLFYDILVDLHEDMFEHCI